jgi:hypothetical protein
MFFASQQFDEAKHLVEAYHYSHRFPPMTQFVFSWHEPGGLFGNLGPMVAACCFAIPPGGWNCGSDEILELQRLVRHPSHDVPPLTGLISRSVKFIKENKITKLLVSFADNTEKHHGGVYQASSWYFGGYRKPCVDGWIVHGKFVPNRTVVARYGSRADSFMRDTVPGSAPHIDMGKFMYWKPVNRKGRLLARERNISALPYPKPSR